MTVKIGTPKYEKNTKNYFSFRKDQNTFILRILPPMGELAESGKWSVFHRVEFGYRTSDGRMKPFLSPRAVNYDGMVEVESESYKRRENLKAQALQAKETGDFETEERVKKLLQQYNQDSKHYMNAVDLNGNIGLFKIGHRGYQALKAEIERLRSEGIDPIGVENGRFLVFNRTGKGRDTVYTVAEYKQKKEITTSEGNTMVIDASYPHSLNESILSKLSTDAFELNKVYPSVTPEEEYRIVHEGPQALDEILGSSKGSTDIKNSSSGNNNSGNNTQQTTSSIQEVSTSIGLENNTELQTQNTSNNLGTQTKQQTSGSELSQMSDEDFFKAVESGNF